jgi:predicted Zn-dependent peptidase
MTARDDSGGALRRPLSDRLMQEQTFYSATLANGLRVLTASLPHTRSVSVSIYISAGSRYERLFEAGLSHFVEHLCFKGTERRPSPREISQIVDSVGGILNAGTDRELTVYYGKVARPHLELVVDVLADMLRFSLFAPEEMEKERRVILEELAMVSDSPSQLVDVLIDELLWPDQPLGWDVAGNRETVSAITRDMALDYLHRQYVPNNMVVSVAGNVSEDEVLDLIGRTMGDWQPGAPSGWFPALKRQGQPGVAVTQKKTEQAHLTLAVYGLPIEHPDRYALDLLSVVLGEGMSSRLFLELRERMGICYDVHSYVDHFLDAGSLGVYAAVDPGNAAKALKALATEVGRLRDGVQEDELRKAKELSKGRLLLRMEDTRSVSGWIGAQELLLGKVRTVDEVVGAMEAVTAEELRRVANELLVEDGLKLAVVGPFRSERRFLPLLKL